MIIEWLEDMFGYLKKRNGLEWTKKERIKFFKKGTAKRGTEDFVYKIV